MPAPLPEAPLPDVLLPDAVLRRLGLSGVLAVRPVTVGLTNRCRQVETVGRIAAVLDFDALTVRPYAREVVRSLMLLFPARNRRGLATAQAAAFVAGYRAVSPLSERQSAEAAEFLRWERACDLGHLERHYGRQDRTRDHLFVMDGLLALLVVRTPGRGGDRAGRGDLVGIDRCNPRGISFMNPCCRPDFLWPLGRSH
ncbi:hypothetical protein AB0D10_16995 [Kitasatospora sp. NPDC048545]|uniref:hypothetical protein n=1 Tax=Kitasatospora sp. NPDC048545 TaxID=3157208 RepID=UPI003405F54B